MDKKTSLFLERRSIRKYKPEKVKKEDLDAVLEAAPPQPVSTPAHRARAVTAAASFLVSIFLIVLVLSCWINCGLNQTKGTGKKDERRGPSVLRMA